MSDGMYDAYADAWACSGWGNCAGCGISGPVNEMREYDGQLYHSHCLPVEMFSVGDRVRVLESDQVGEVAGLGQFAVIVRLSFGHTVGFLPRELVLVGGA